jgi:hypothetical protein
VKQDVDQSLQRIQQNKLLNDKKKDQIKLGRAAQAAFTPSVSRGTSRKRKAADMPEEDERQAQPNKKRTRRTKADTEPQGGLLLGESFQVARPGQSPLPPTPSQDYLFPLDPALTQDVHNEEWVSWLNYEQALVDPYGEALDHLSHRSHHAPHQGSSMVSQHIEEDQQTKPARQRKRTAKS